MDGLVKFLFVGIFILAIVVIGGGFVAGQAAEGYARGGGQMEARLLSPETYSSATAGDNSVVVAITGDDNGVNVAYSQQREEPTPEPPVPDNVNEERALAGVLMVLVAIVAIGLLLAVLLGIV